MRVGIAALGTRGDVAPLLDIGVRLREAGHHVVMAAMAPFGPEVEACGLEFRALGGDVRDSDIAGSNPLKLVMLAVAPSMIRSMAAMVLDAFQHEPLDVLALSPFAEFGGHALAEAKGIPSIGLRLQPLSTSSCQPPSVLGAWSAGSIGNRIAGRAGTALVDVMYGKAVAEIRGVLGLAPLGVRAARRRRSEAGWPILHGYSQAVVPRPDDWRTGLDVVGYWWPRRMPDWRPPAELVDFLRSGPPPVFLGFGSVMTGEKSAARMSELATTALAEAGVRAVVQAGWANLAASGEQVLTIGETPHDWLFPQMAAVAHACGAGTTAAGLRAGVPAVGVPVAGDQPFWARRLRDLGVSPATVPWWRLKAKPLAAAIRAAVEDNRYREQAQRIAARLADEDGAGAAVTAIERLTARSAPASDSG